MPAPGKLRPHTVGTSSSGRKWSDRSRQRHSEEGAGDPAPGLPAPRPQPQSASRSRPGRPALPHPSARPPGWLRGAVRTAPPAGPSPRRRRSLTLASTSSAAILATSVPRAGRPQPSRHVTALDQRAGLEREPIKAVAGSSPPPRPPPRGGSCVLRKRARAPPPEDLTNRPHPPLCLFFKALALVTPTRGWSLTS